MTSCQRDVTADTATGDVNVTVSATLPAGMVGTRAAGDGLTVDRCIMQVYLDGKPYGERQTVALQDLKATFTARLVSGRKYNLVFWADKSGTDLGTDLHYDTSDFTDVSFTGGYAGNDESRDAFFGSVELTASESQAIAVELRRPFGQLNVRTLDMAEIPADLVPALVKVSFAEVPTGIDLLTGELTGETAAAVYAEAAALADNKDNAGNLTVDYIFAPKAEGEQRLVNFTMSFLDANEAAVASDYEFTNIPVQRNYRTNVTGNLLTKKADVTVTIVPDFYGEIGRSTWTGRSETPVIDDDAKSVDVNTAEQLAGFVELVNGGTTFEGYTVTLNSSLDLNNLEWTPAGVGVRSGSDPVGASFKGTFDGQGNTVSNLRITECDNADSAIGLFGIVDGGEVRNLVFENVDIDVPTSEMAAAAVGMLTGGGTVSGIDVASGSITATRGNGAVVGRMTVSGTITDCHNGASVNGTGANVGGIVGAAYYTAEGETMTISDCTNDGAINCTAGVAGGIVGLSAANVSGCTNNATVTGNGTDVAGIVAEQQNAGSVTDCTNNGDIVNNSTGYGTGGIVGWIRYNGATSAYPAKNVITVSGCTNYGSVQGGNDAGGIVGTVYNMAEIDGNRNFAPTLSARTFAAGIVGNAQFTETAVGMTEDDMVYVRNNYSTTTLDNMLEAYCKDLFVYINNGDKVTVSGNMTEYMQTLVGELVAGGDVTLGEDVDFSELGSSLTLSSDTRIDLNGHSVKLATGQLRNSATLTITGDGELTAPAQVIYNEGKVVIESGMYRATGSGDASIVFNGNGGEVVINGGDLKTSGRFAIQNNYGKSVTINGGSIVSTSTGDYCILMHGSGTLTVTNGHIEGNFGCVRLHGGTHAKISGGEFASTGTYYALFVGATGTGATAEVSGGRFLRTKHADGRPCVYVGSGNELTLTGGWFSDKGHDANSNSELVPAAGYIFANTGDTTCPYRVVAE